MGGKKINPRPPSDRRARCGMGCSVGGDGIAECRTTGRMVPNPDGPKMQHGHATGEISGAKCHLLVVSRAGEQKMGMRFGAEYSTGKEGGRVTTTRRHSCAYDTGRLLCLYSRQ